MDRHTEPEGGRKPVNDPRPCPFCKTLTPAAPDRRFTNPAWRWDCNEHGVFGFLIVMDPLG